MIGRLLALQHGDTAFPSGSFAFSNGVEGLAALRPPLDAKALRAAVAATIRHRWAGMDRAALVHAFRADGDLAILGSIDRALEAATPAEPLRTGSRRNGGSLLAAHARLGTPHAAALREAVRAEQLLGHLATVQGALWRGLGLAEADAVAVAGYQTASGLIAAAVRLGQVGAIEAQRVLAAILPLIEEAAAQPVAALAEGVPFTSFVPLIEIAAMRQAHAELRLFAN